MSDVAVKFNKKPKSPKYDIVVTGDLAASLAKLPADSIESAVVEALASLPTDRFVVKNRDKTGLTNNSRNIDQLKEKFRN